MAMKFLKDLLKLELQLNLLFMKNAALHGYLPLDVPHPPTENGRICLGLPHS